MKNYIDKANRQVFKYDEKIGHKYIENIETRIINENGGYFLKTNSSGFRSDIEFRKKKGKQKRILFFGDSKSDYLAAKAFDIDFVFISGASEWENPTNSFTFSVKNFTDLIEP